MQNLTEVQVISLLVKMADDFDRVGNYDLAYKADQTIKSFSSRPKAPLKKLDDDVKKNLIVFVHDADQSISKSIKGLKELFRRLRYFDLAGSVKDTGLDKLVREMEKIQHGLGGAKNKLYELMIGRKPSVQALNDFLGTQETVDEQNALDFFARQSDTEEDTDLEPEEDGKDIEESEEDIEGEDLEDLENDEEKEDLTDEMEEELENFLAGLEDEETHE